MALFGPQNSSFALCSVRDAGKVPGPFPLEPSRFQQPSYQTLDLEPTSWFQGIGLPTTCKGPPYLVLRTLIFQRGGADLITVFLFQGQRIPDTPFTGWSGLRRVSRRWPARSDRTRPVISWLIPNRVVIPCLSIETPKEVSPDRFWVYHEMDR